MERGLGIDPFAPRVRTAGLGGADRGQRDAGGAPELAGRRQLDDAAGKAPVRQRLVELGPAQGEGARALVVPGEPELGAHLGQECLEVVRRGTRRGHTYHLLAAQRGPRKTFEPFLVTLNDKSEVFPGFQHPGTEFIYLLAGSLTYRHGRHSYPLGPGDSLSFRGDVPHGPEKLDKVPIRMLSIIIYADS